MYIMHDYIHKFLIEMAKNKSDTDSSDSYQISEPNLVRAYWNNDLPYPGHGRC